MAVWLGLRSLRSLQPSQTQTSCKPENGLFLMCYGPEMTSRHFLAWCLEKKIELVHIQPGKPTQNGRVESFNGRLREELLRISWFENLFDARRKIADWRKDYNEQRPHSSLGYRTPSEFAAQAAGLYRTEVGQEASNAGPLPQTPIPATLRGEENTEKVSLSLD